MTETGVITMRCEEMLDSVTKETNLSVLQAAEKMRTQLEEVIEVQARNEKMLEAINKITKHAASIIRFIEAKTFRGEDFDGNMIKNECEDIKCHCSYLKESV